MKNIFLGIGNRLRGDDGAGSIAAERLVHSDWLSIDGSHIPENYTGVIRRERPDLLVILDACDLGEPPGTYRRIPLEQLSRDSGFNTHRAPLAFLIDYLASYSGRMVFIGIQPGDISFNSVLSSPVERGIEEIMDCLVTGKIDDIPATEPD